MEVSLTQGGSEHDDGGKTPLLCSEYVHTRYFVHDADISVTIQGISRNRVLAELV